MEKMLAAVLEKNGIEDWKLRITRRKGAQGYFIGGNPDMMRRIDTADITLTVYRNIVDGGNRYRGSMTVELSPSMYEQEITEKIQIAEKGAAAVRNRWYPLPGRVSDASAFLPDAHRFDGKDPGDWVKEISSGISSLKIPDVLLNAMEISVVRNDIVFLNSEGRSLSWAEYSGFIELVTGAEGGKDGEVELAALYSFSDYPVELIGKTIPKQIEGTLARAQAVPMPALKNIPVILKGRILWDFFSFFLFNAWAESVYEGTSGYREGLTVQKGGDLLTVTVTPVIPGSSRNTVADSDGVVPVETRILDRGKVCGIISDIQFGTYLGRKITGKQKNIVVESGSVSRKNLSAAPFIEIADFSDFTMDPITGAFGGEVRLAYYYDGNRKIPVTGGSVTGRMDEVIDSIGLSSSVSVEDGYSGPDFVVLQGMSVTGVEG